MYDDDRLTALDALKRNSTPLVECSGYHDYDIPKGQVGTWAKVHEEVLEMADAIVQDNPVMALCEASDVVGALRCWLKVNHPEISFEQLCNMSERTERAFATGRRKSS